MASSKPTTTTMTTATDFQDYLPLIATKLGGEGLINELCNGFQLLMDKEKGVITFDSLKRNSAILMGPDHHQQQQNQQHGGDGGVTMTDDELISMMREGDLDGDGCLNQMEFCVLMFRLSPELMEASEYWLEQSILQSGEENEERNGSGVNWGSSYSC